MQCHHAIALDIYWVYMYLLSVEYEMIASDRSKHFIPRYIAVQAVTTVISFTRMINQTFAEPPMTCSEGLAYPGCTYCNLVVPYRVAECVPCEKKSNPLLPIWRQTISLTYWDRKTHVHVCTIDSDNGMSARRRWAIIWTNAGILLIWPLGTNISEILIEIDIFSFVKMYLKMSSGN